MTGVIMRPGDWSALATVARTQFKLDFGVDLVLDADQSENFEAGFCLYVSTSPVDLLGGTLVWRGIFGGNLYDGGNSVFLSLTMFPYLDGRRLVTQMRGDFVEYRYQAGDKGGHWHRQGLQIDEHGEFFAFAPVEQ